jgi:hypothetical protein
MYFGSIILSSAACAAVARYFHPASLGAEKGDRKTAIADYSNRSGFPQGLDAGWGAARDFAVPDDMKTPPLLRPLQRARERA